VTTLTRTIRREVAVPRMRPIIIEIDPETAKLIFREKGCRTAYSLPIATAYMMAIRTAKED
jgi:hypothetical protein